jgi:hypothetical protein
MVGRPKAKWDRESVLIWIATRDNDLAQNASRRAASWRRDHKRNTGHDTRLNALFIAIVELGIKTTYRRDRKAPDPAKITSALHEAEAELRASGINPSTEGLFDREIVKARWPSERRKWVKDHFAYETLQPWIRLIVTERPMHWADIRAWLGEKNVRSIDSRERDKQPKNRSHKSYLNAAIGFARAENEKLFQAGAIDRPTFEKRRGLIEDWHESRKGTGLRERKR